MAREGLSRHPDAPSLAGIELPALAALGHSGEVVSRVEELLELRPTAIGPLIATGDELHAHGHPEAATRVWARLVRVLRPRTGAAGAEAASPTPSLVELLERLGRDREAFELLPVLAPRDSLTYVEHVGILAARRGDRAEAEWALDWLAERSGAHLRGRHLHAQARIAAELGDAERAIERLRRGLSRSGAYTAVHRDYHLRGLRGHPDFEALATRVKYDSAVPAGAPALQKRSQPLTVEVMAKVSGSRIHPAQITSTNSTPTKRPKPSTTWGSATQPMRGGSASRTISAVS